MSDSEAESKGGKVLSAYLTAFGAWLEASWPLTGADLKGYAEWLQAAGSALWECSVDHSSKAGWRAVTIQSVMKKAMLWEKDWVGEGTSLNIISESLGMIWNILDTLQQHMKGMRSCHLKILAHLRIQISCKLVVVPPRRQPSFQCI